MKVLNHIREKSYSRNVYGALLVVVAGLLATLSNAITHTLSDYPSLQILFFKSGVAFFLFLLIYHRHLKSIMPTKILPIHAIKSVLGAAGNWAWILGLQYLTLADASSLSLTSALFTSLGGLLIYKEPFRWPVWIALLMGFLGVLLIIDPSQAIFSLYGLLPVVSAFCFSGSSLIVKTIAKKDHSLTTLFYLLFFMFILSLASVYQSWVMPQGMALIKLITLGVCYILTQLAIIEAYTYAQATFIAPFKFSRLPFNVLVGIFFFAEWPTLFTLLGSALIIVSYLLIGWSERHKKNKKKGTSKNNFLGDRC